MKTIVMFELETLLKKNKLNILDVREKEEFMYGHIKDANLASISKFNDVIKTLDKKTHYYVVCESGSRSFAVSKYLSEQGYNVTNVLGGMSSYKGELSYEV